MRNRLFVLCFPILLSSCYKSTEVEIVYFNNQCFSWLTHKDGFIRTIPYWIKNNSKDTVYIIEHPYSIAEGTNGGFMFGSNKADIQSVTFAEMGYEPNDFRPDTFSIYPGYAKQYNLTIGEVGDTVRFIRSRIEYSTSGTIKELIIEFDISTMKNCVQFQMFDPGTLMYEVKD